jgi:Xaa-Pro aminopeptidase
MVDLGGRLNHYTSDVTRMLHVGATSAKYNEVHGVVEDAVQSALAAVRPGAALADVDRAAREVITRAGYGERFIHRTGHGLGLTGHEPPSVTANNGHTIEVGMVFSIEPGIYLPDEFGVRLEEIVAVGASGPEILGGLSRALILVPGEPANL